MLITADQLVAHAIGDYVLQSDWMANEKTKKSIAAALHAVTYSLPFCLIAQSGLAMAVIIVTHFIIDRWRLARYVCWAKNFFAPPSTMLEVEGKVIHQRWWHPWADCVGTGYHRDRPPWMAVWLMIIADNVLHVLCNGAAIKYLT